MVDMVWNEGGEKEMKNGRKEERKEERKKKERKRKDEGKMFSLLGLGGGGDIMGGRPSGPWSRNLYVYFVL